MLRNDGDFHIDWQWLDNQPSIHETEPVRHVRLHEPLTIKVDGRTGHGVIQRTNR
jgi:hypothetical protein